MKKEEKLFKKQKMTKKNFLFKKILNYKKIILHTHINPDGDAVGAIFGLKELINDNWEEKDVLVVVDPVHEKLPIDVVSDEDSLKSGDYKGALVIVCDVANEKRIYGKYWKNAKEIIKIDHHPEGDKYADFEFVDENAIATCQIIAKWGFVNDLFFSKKSSKSLFLGIVCDSNRFLYPKTNSDTFLTASKLLRTKFNLHNFYRKLYTKKKSAILIKKYIYQKLKFSASGKVAFSFVKPYFFTKNKQFDLNERETITSFVYLLEGIEDVLVWLIALKNEQHKEIKISVRSRKIPINKFVKKFGGGGHENACGVRLKRWKDVYFFIEEIERFLKNFS